LRNSIIPVNDLNDLVFTGEMPNMARSFTKTLARMNPMLLAPMELQADRQFATGRKISELEPLTGNNWIDRIAHYLPTSRIMGEARTVIDKRKGPVAKGINLLGLGGVSTYNTDLWQKRDLRDAYGEQLDAIPEMKLFQDYYIPKTKRAEMAPDKLAMIRAVQKRRQQLMKKMENARKRQDAAQL
jgi:hypothetical protein